MNGIFINKLIRKPYSLPVTSQPLEMLKSPPGYRIQVFWSDTNSVFEMRFDPDPNKTTGSETQEEIRKKSVFLEDRIRFRIRFCLEGRIRIRFFFSHKDRMRVKHSWIRSPVLLSVSQK